MSPSPFARFLDRIRTALEAPAAPVILADPGSPPSVFPVGDLAAAAIGAAGLAVADLIAQDSGQRPAVTVSQRLSALWFDLTLRPQGWAPPPPWDPVAGDYRTSDGWIRLHTNAPHHRAAALSVLGVPAERAAVAGAVAGWRAEELEAATVAAGGCAARLRSAAEWAIHPQGQAVAAEPLIHIARIPANGGPARQSRAPQGDSPPLAGVRVLDLTRVLAGPAATRFLAGYGADVLRIDPPFWNEPSLEPDMTLGKRRARLDLRQASDRATLERLLAGADILVLGYRADALDRLGFGPDRIRALNPGLIDIRLNAYGWTGPWANRRGFDSLVQMSSGIAHAGMSLLERDRPTPLPVQALDHAAGYLLAAAALRGLSHRRQTGEGFAARVSLARVAGLLTASPIPGPVPPPARETPADLDPTSENTAWGPAQRLRAPLMVAGHPLRWRHPAGPLGTDRPDWE